MNDNAFFKPTLLYKEFLILDLIEKDSSITQRAISKALGVAVSMINSYIDTFEDKGYIKRHYISTKTVEYFITKKGSERKKLLNIWYLKSTHAVYDSAKNNIIAFLNQVIQKGYKKLLLYGAGEVAEIMLQTIQDDAHIPLEVIAVIDDDKMKIGNKLINKKVITRNDIKAYDHDAILVSSYTHHDEIVRKLNELNYDKNKILSFF